MYLVHHCPGLFATSENKLSQSDQKKTKAQNSPASEGLPFTFPVIANPSLTFTKEDGSSEEVPIDVLPIDIQGDVKEHYRQGKRSITIPIWICGPSQLGRHNITVHFYYEPNKKNQRIV